MEDGLNREPSPLSRPNQYRSAFASAAVAHSSVYLLLILKLVRLPMNASGDCEKNLIQSRETAASFQPSVEKQKSESIVHNLVETRSDTALRAVAFLEARGFGQICGIGLPRIEAKLASADHLAPKD